MKKIIITPSNEICIQKIKDKGPIKQICARKLYEHCNLACPLSHIDIRNKSITLCDNSMFDDYKIILSDDYK